MSPFLLALGNREELVRNGKLTSIIFVRDVNSKGQEVSGYIDYAHRLRSTNFEPYFERRKKVRPVAFGLWLINYSRATAKRCRWHDNDARGLLGQADEEHHGWSAGRLPSAAMSMVQLCCKIIHPSKWIIFQQSSYR